VRPRQFGTQCVPNWESLVELPHGSQVTLRKPFAKLSGQPFRQVRKQISTILGTLPDGFGNLPATFAGLHNVPDGSATAAHNRHACEIVLVS